MSEKQELLHTDRVLIVEGKYDAARLSHLTDAMILLTDGFGIYKDKKRQQLFKTLARRNGLILLTDSDGAGFVIRNHLKGALPREKVKQAYIPDIAGKERRKRRPGKEGKLGVEGMDPATLLSVLRRCGATFEEEGEKTPAGEPITKADLFALGLSGGSGSAERRKALAKALDLPEHLSPNALLDVLNLLTTREELAETLRRLAGEIGE